jgi:hypothetical protein
MSTQNNLIIVIGSVKLESNMVDYICMYGAYKLPHRKPIFNSLAIIIQLINFLMTIYLLISHITKGIAA